MSHEFRSEAKTSLGDKLGKMVGKRGEYPPDRAARIVGPNPGGGQGDSVKPTDEIYAGAPARQVSNYGKIRGA